jgi:hypothetical protein
MKPMATLKRLVLSLACLAVITPASAERPSPHDASHDFDFVLGTFHTHIKRLLHPLSGASEWTTYDGIKTDVPILGGQGSLEEIEADGSTGHLEFLTLRLYNSSARPWSLNFSSSDLGHLATPAIGEFNGGVGTFLDQESYNGRTILVRQQWSPLTPGTYHFEQAFSADFGKSWEVNFVADLHRKQG